MRSTVVPAASRRLPSSPSCKLSPLSTALASMGVLLVMPVQAQTSAAVSQSTVLEQVTVRSDRGGRYTSGNVQVGTFRDQDPLDVPLTNNVVTREVLDAQGANTLYGALRNTAGVNHSQLNGGTYDIIAIRGVAADNRDNYRLNGSLPIINLVAVPLENKERVEVLKGSSSLYYGLVPPSGIVNFVTKRAGNAPVTSLATSVNNHGAVDIHADLGRRFGADNSMGLRVNAVAGKEETGVRRFEGDRQLLSAAYDWRLTPAFVVKVDLEHYRKDVTETPTVTLPRVGGRAVVPRVPDNRSNAGGEWARYDAEATNALLRADWSLNEQWLLTLETGQAEVKRDRDYPNFTFAAGGLDSGEGNLRVFNFEGLVYKNRVHRADLVGQLHTGPVSHELTLGTSYSTRDSYSGNSASFVTYSQNLYDPRPVPESQPPATRRGNTVDITDKGVYLFDRLTFSPQWQMMAGVRYIDYRFKTLSGNGTVRDDRFEDVAPNLSLLYKPSDTVSIYASYLKGMEPNSYIPATNGNVPVSNAGGVLPPSENRQKELGIKARLSPGSMLQASVFELERALQTFEPDGALRRAVIGGESRYRGLELSYGGELSRNFSLLGSALFLDAEITRVGISNPNELNKTPENTPKRTFSLFGEYRVPQVPGWSVNAGAFYVGKRAVNNVNDAYVGGYTITSLGTRYKTQLSSTPVTLQLNVDNLTDRDYWNTAGNGLLGVGLPRAVRLAAKFDF